MKKEVISVSLCVKEWTRSADGVKARGCEKQRITCCLSSVRTEL